MSHNEKRQYLFVLDMHDFLMYAPSQSICGEKDLRALEPLEAVQKKGDLAISPSCIVIELLRAAVIIELWQSSDCSVREQQQPPLAVFFPSSSLLERPR
jgi:hypothetical protein